MSKKEKKTLIIALIVLLIAAVSIAVTLILNYGSQNVKPRLEYEEDVDEIRLADIGSAKKLEGMTVIVAIFADDTDSSWDFDTETDRQSRNAIFKMIDTAAKKLESEGKRYNKQLSFAYPDSEDSILYYETSFDTELVDVTKSIVKDPDSEWEYIENNIDSEAIRKKYNCDNIVYQLFTNQQDINKDASMAIFAYGKPLKYPYELCYFPLKPNLGLCSSTIMHEMLHTFAAPDLYKGDVPYNYKIPSEFINFVKDNFENDIMFSTFVKDDEGNKVRPPDGGIPMEITEVTAYFLGWLDYTPEWVDEYNIVHNQFEYYDSLQSTATEN